MASQFDRILTFADYWVGKRRAAELPRLADLLPEEMFRALPNLVVWEVVDDGADYLCTLCGEDLNDNYGWNPKGHRLNDIIRDNRSIAVFKSNFDRVREVGDAITVIDRFEGHRGTTKRTVGVVAPLSDGAGAIAHIICCAIYVSNGESEIARGRLMEALAGA